MTKPDGGPAFPRTAYPDSEAGRNGAFTTFAQDGMSLRQWLAGQAGQEAFSLLMEHSGQDWMGANLSGAIATLAETKLAIADAMIAAEEKEPDDE